MFIGPRGGDLCLFLCLICWSKSPVMCCESELKNECHGDKSACWEMFNMTAIFLKSAGSVYSTQSYKTFISTAGFTEINQEKYLQRRHHFLRENITRFILNPPKFDRYFPHFLNTSVCVWVRFWPAAIGVDTFPSEPFGLLTSNKFNGMKFKARKERS